jgi:hypothetical protein
MLRLGELDPQRIDIPSWAPEFSRNKPRYIPTFQVWIADDIDVSITNAVLRTKGFQIGRIKSIVQIVHSDDSEMSYGQNLVFDFASTECRMGRQL